MLLLGLLLRAVLVPISGWGLDTPGFIAGSVSLLGGGSPYASQLYFEPPLGAVLQAPLVYLAGPAFHAPLLSFDPSIAPLQFRTQIAFATIPSPLALTALKLPMVASDLVGALLLFHLVAARWGLRWAGIATALWWLNPVVIWSSAVVGQPDTLAATLLLLFVFSTQRGAWGLAGWAVGLGAMAKLYPILLLPVAVALLATATEIRSRRRALLTFLAGIALAILPFAILLQGYGRVLLVRGTNSVYGGLSLSTLFNPASPTFGGLFGSSGGPGGAAVLTGLQALGVLAVLGAPVLLAIRRRRDHPGRKLPSGDLITLTSLWSVSGAILLLPSPQPENFVGLLAALAISLPLLGPPGRTVLAAITFAASLLAMTLLGPLALFYPLAERLGPGSVAVISTQVSAFWSLPGAWGHGTFWWIAGIVAGASTILLWTILLRLLWPTGAVARVPPSSAGAIDPRPEPSP